MDIKTAEFSLSAPVVSMCPEDTKPEYAFIGRSNVGKSSLINMLTNNRKLAKTSATPGKTLLINHFIINREWYLVDLPGYGFAKRSKTEVTKLDQMIRGYILQREQLVNLFVLVDIRLEPQKIDLEFIDWLGQSGVPFSIIFTKADKLSAAKAAQNVEAYKKTLQETWEELPPIFVTSAEKKQGRDDVLNYIPARLTGLLFIGAAWLLKFDHRHALAMMKRDASKHPSPNGGYAEATVAGALHIRLGGINSYFGKKSLRAYMGEAIELTAPKHIMECIRMMYTVTVMFIIITYAMFGL